ncbi:sulfotransferase [Streptomyces sp. ODS28]|uniref:sulfotransferase family protein n=1 Tax=Streptomyces sp. ODS28 TaxID=3136688 RepID=UPI0031EF8619
MTSPNPTSRDASRNLTFVVGTGRSGSTALSRILRLHPDVLSLNELFACVQNAAMSEEALDGREFWALLTAPNHVFDTMIRSGAPLPEFLYNRHPEWRYSAEKDGIPAVSLMPLPHLSDAPDALLDSLEPEVRGWPTRPAPQQWEAFFEALARRCGGARAAVERSGYSLHHVPLLRRMFPRARFVHLFRDGPDCALSMSRHPGYRMILLLREIAERCGAGRSPGALAQLTPEQVAALPPDLAGLLGERFDRALVMERPLAAERFGALWSELVAEGAGYLEELPQEIRTTLSYEELLGDPRGELSRLARFVGVEPLPGWLDAGERLLDSGRAGAALRLPAGELEALRESCAPGMRVLRTGQPGAGAQASP